MRKWRLLFLTSFAVAALAATTAEASASNSWNGYHWARSSPSSTVRLTVLDSVTSSWDANLSKANADWNRSPVFENTLSSSDSSATTRRSCPAAAGKVRVCNYAYGSTGWLGVAEIDLSSGTHIAWGTTKVNDSYSMGTYAKQHVMCQEVGHDFGLDHQFTNAGSCMDYAGQSDPAYVSPNSHDYSELLSIYNHGDGSAAASNGSQSKIVAGGVVTSIFWKD
ncbi:hypothetical protein GCM10022222_37670 [Amycolatopsis ultiminotia]|uniref:Uncharacterized protein n=1 Tax=Amycolatopsis ultiminotia TaxID=543629 RepID=A0ABP6WKP9_9PSEU